MSAVRKKCFRVDGEGFRQYDCFKEEVNLHFLEFHIVFPNPYSNSPTWNDNLRDFQMWTGWDYLFPSLCDGQNCLWSWYDRVARLKYDLKKTILRISTELVIWGYPHYPFCSQLSQSYYLGTYHAFKNDGSRLFLNPISTPFTKICHPVVCWYVALIDENNKSLNTSNDFVLFMTWTL